MAERDRTLAEQFRERAARTEIEKDGEKDEITRKKVSRTVDTALGSD